MAEVHYPCCLRSGERQSSEFGVGVPIPRGNIRRNGGMEQNRPAG